MTCIDLSHELNTIATGSIDGKVEFFDFESKSKCAELIPKTFSKEEISCLKFEPGTLNLYVGTEKGKVI